MDQLAAGLCWGEDTVENAAVSWKTLHSRLRVHDKADIATCK